MEYTPQEVAKLLANRPHQPHHVEWLLEQCLKRELAAERERCAKACRSAVYGRLGSATMRQVADWCAEEIESGRQPLPGA